MHEYSPACPGYYCPSLGAGARIADRGCARGIERCAVLRRIPAVVQLAYRRWRGRKEWAVAPACLASWTALGTFLVPIPRSSNLRDYQEQKHSSLVLGIKKEALRSTTRRSWTAASGPPPPAVEPERLHTHSDLSLHDGPKGPADTPLPDPWAPFELGKNGWWILVCCFPTTWQGFYTCAGAAVWTGILLGEE